MIYKTHSLSGSQEQWASLIFISTLAIGTWVISLMGGGESGAKS